MVQTVGLQAFPLQPEDTPAALAIIIGHMRTAAIVSTGLLQVKRKLTV